MRHFTLPEDGGLITKNLPKDILHGYDKIFTEVYADSTEGSRKLADIVVESLNKFEKENPGGTFRLGLTTGATPASLYKVLSRYYREGRISFKNVEVYSIDEYYPSSPTDMQSRNRNLHLELLNNVDIKPENIHIPNGTVPHEDVAAYCERFDKAARGLDLLIIGIGEQGQVGFNEAGSSDRTRTRTVLLSYPSRKRQARYFNGDVSVTPKEAITMGISTMMSAKRVILMAWGETKTAAVARIVEGEIGSDCPATYFQHHDNVMMFVDEVSGSELTRVIAPWRIGPCEWTPKFRRKAVIWLCQQVHKPILKLTQADYLQHSLEELLDTAGGFNQVNIQVFNDLQHTITGWPGGKPNADDSTRPVASKPFPKKVLVLSPHPDDDVISMGGTLIRLVHQGHDVHVAYQTSGNVAVHDSVVMQHIDAARQLGYGDRTAEVQALIDSKVPGEPEPRPLLDIKAAIRRSEARAADYSFGMSEDHIHFLNLPFYESGGIRKLPCSQADVD
ncbi:MAG: 6-phosphogluconolactonase, partial [Eggerthellaceae bacterium]|nr:6-phosphogluconolactonase [Eggerthellaceae bacterium]